MTPLRMWLVLVDMALLAMLSRWLPDVAFYGAALVIGIIVIDVRLHTGGMP